MRIFTLLLLIALAGCAASPEEIAAADSAKCVELGFAEGTAAHGSCRLALMRDRSASRAAWAAAVAGAGAEMEAALSPPRHQRLQTYCFRGAVGNMTCF